MLQGTPSSQLRTAGRLAEAVGEAISQEANVWEQASDGWSNSDYGALAGSLAGEILAGAIIAGAIATPAIALPVAVAAGAAVAAGVPAGVLIGAGILGAAALGFGLGELGGNLGEAIGGLFDNPQLCPLVFDLDGDGLEFTTLAQSSAYFDLDGDSFAEWTGWVRPDDGLLAIDTNANGRIDGLAEVFGGAAGGFQALAALDSNHDGAITAADAQFAQLRMWRDLNQNGLSEDGELSSLATTGITSISLGATTTDYTLAGHRVTATSTFTFAGGGTGQAVDVRFTNSQAHTYYAQDVTITADALQLPTLKGYGIVKDLRVAMSERPDLQAAVEALVDDRHTFTTYSDFRAAFETVLEKWIGVDAVSPTSRGANVDGQHLAGLERLMGQLYGNGGNPTSEAGEQLDLTWSQTVDAYSVRFLTQLAQLDRYGAARDAIRDLAEDMANDPDMATAQIQSRVHDALMLIDPDATSTPLLRQFAGLSFDGAGDTLTGDLPAEAGALYEAARATLFDPSVPAAGAADAWRIFFAVAATSTDSAVAAMVAAGRIYFPDDPTNPVRGGASADSLVGTTNADVVVGNDGADSLDGARGDDVLIGGAGNDSLSGNGDNDTYVFAAGGGNDVIREWGFGKAGFGGNDTIHFEAGVGAGDVTVVQANATDLVLQYGANRITIANQLVSDDYDIEQVTFADGTVWTQADLVARATIATAGDDTFYGDSAANTLSGGSGADALDGARGDDTLTGGGGNDSLSGNGDNDTYVFADGAGNDVIREWGLSKNGFGGNDTIRFEGATGPADVTVSQANAGADLVLQYGGNRITVANQFINNDYDIEQVVFGDGTTWTQAELLARATVATNGADTFYGDWFANTLSGAAGVDALDGAQGDDTLTGGVGNDSLSGNGDNDTYVFAAGDGNDVIREWGMSKNGFGGNDTIRFEAGVAPGDVTVSQANAGADLVLQYGSSRITVANQFINDDYDVEQVAFADGTVWTQADLLARATVATGGADTFYGDWFANTLSGAAGNDALDGARGNDTLTGGVGNDSLSGNGDNDTYVFAAGDGNDVIREWGMSKAGFGGTDTIRFEAGVAPGDVTVSQANAGADLVLQYGSSRITVANQFINDDYDIEQVTFSDGTTWTQADLLARATVATGGADTFYGDWFANTLSGAAGNDALDGARGNDTLTGGAGNDSLSGNGDNDTYVFAGGDGNDVIREWGMSKAGFGGTDTIRFEAGVGPGDVTLSKVNSDLVLDYGGSRITVVNQFLNNDYDIEQVVFADGTTWTQAYINSLFA